MYRYFNLTIDEVLENLTQMIRSLFEWGRRFIINAISKTSLSCKGILAMTIRRTSLITATAAWWQSWDNVLNFCIFFTFQIERWAPDTKQEMNHTLRRLQLAPRLSQVTTAPTAPEAEKVRLATADTKSLSNFTPPQSANILSTFGIFLFLCQYFPMVYIQLLSSLPGLGTTTLSHTYFNMERCDISYIFKPFRRLQVSH